ncbi:MAG: T9SS type A sorting domain-containing protein [Bacteroidetes bacterium]|nr:T9SS type A sorting domain-containing protein [Bacteroidota bacterium]
MMLKLNYTLLAATFAVGSLFTSAKAQSPMQNDTIWGNGIFTVFNNESTPISYEDIHCTPLQMQGDTIPDTTYVFTTDNNGQAPFNLPVYIDIIDGIKDNQTLDAIVAPNPSSDFNFAFHGKPLSQLEFFDMSGKRVKTVKVDYDGKIASAYVDMSKEAPGTYVFSALTENGKVGGKIVKTNTPPSGEHKPNLPSQSPFKSSDWTFTATYGIHISHPGHYDLDEEVDIVDGDNGYINFTMQKFPPIPQLQYIGGSVKDEQSNPMPSAIVRILNQNTNEVIDETNPDPDGDYLLGPVPTGTDFYFQVGDVPGYYSFDGDEASTPIQITNPDDTLRTVFHYKLPADTAGVPAYKIRDFTGNSNIEAALRNIKYYLNSAFDEEDKNLIRDNFTALNEILGNDTLFVESLDSLNQNIAGYDPYTNPLAVGINISPGTNNTNPDFIYVTTPLGNNIPVVFKAEMSLVTGFFLGQTHEGGRACGEQQTNWYGIMQVGAPAFTNDDKFIWKLDLAHFKDVYNGNIYFGLNNIVDNLSEKSNKKNKGSDHNSTPLKEKPLPSIEYVLQ